MSRPYIISLTDIPAELNPKRDRRFASMSAASKTAQKMAVEYGTRIRVFEEERRRNAQGALTRVYHNLFAYDPDGSYLFWNAERLDFEVQV